MSAVEVFAVPDREVRQVAIDQPGHVVEVGQDDEYVLAGSLDGNISFQVEACVSQQIARERTVVQGAGDGLQRRGRWRPRLPIPELPECLTEPTVRDSSIKRNARGIRSP